jgi:hypothetical protein
MSDRVAIRDSFWDSVRDVDPEAAWFMAHSWRWKKNA